MATPSELDEIRQRLPIEQIISPYVTLKGRGDRLSGLCPFHQEKTPSFYVTPSLGRYHCFGCNADGDIFTFTQRMENIAFPEAVERLAQRAGVTLRTRTDPNEDKLRDRWREVLELTQRFWHDLLLRGERAQFVRDYLKSRDISWASVESFGLGWAPDGFTTTHTWLQERGVSIEELKALGLVKDRDSDRGGGVYDTFRNRLIFPIRDQRGRLTGFGGRALDPDAKPKYLNSAESPLFKKNETLYALDQALGGIRDSDQVVVVEGYVDALIAHQFGIKNVIASMGTALTERQVGFLKRLTNRIVLALDADAAGSEATVRGLGIIESVFRTTAIVPTARGGIRQQPTVEADIRILALPDGEDPDDVIRRSVDEWRNLVENALPFVDFYILHYTRNLDREDVNSTSAAADTILDKIALIANPLTQEQYLARLAGKLPLPLPALRQRLAERRHRQRSAGSTEPGEPREPRSPDWPEPTTDHEPRRSAARPRRLSLEERVLRLVCQHPAPGKVMATINPSWFESTLTREFAVELQRRFDAEPAARLEDVRDALSPLLADYVEFFCAGLDDDPPLPEFQADNLVAEALARLEKSALDRELSAARAALAVSAGDDVDATPTLWTRLTDINRRLDELYRRQPTAQDPDYRLVGASRTE